MTKPNRPKKFIKINPTKIFPNELMFSKIREKVNILWALNMFPKKVAGNVIAQKNHIICAYIIAS